MNPETAQKQLDTFIEPAPKAGALNLRPFSPGTLTLCRKLGLSMIVGAPDVVQTSEERRIIVDALAEAAGGARGMAADARSKSAGQDKDSDAAYTRAFAPLQKQLQDSMSAVIAKQPKGWENWSGFDTKPARRTDLWRRILGQQYDPRRHGRRSICQLELQGMVFKKQSALSRSHDGSRVAH